VKKRTTIPFRKLGELEFRRRSQAIATLGTKIAEMEHIYGRMEVFTTDAYVVKTMEILKGQLAAIKGTLKLLLKFHAEDIEREVQHGLREVSETEEGATEEKAEDSPD
jgi:hypothetical protein